jgi:hypothetical protein
LHLPVSETEYAAHLESDGKGQLNFTEPSEVCNRDQVSEQFHNYLAKLSHLLKGHDGEHVLIVECGVKSIDHTHKSAVLVGAEFAYEVLATPLSVR